MTFQFNDNDRKRLHVTVTTSIDPATGTVALAIDGTEHPCTWAGAATQTGSTWTREADTNTYFAGPAVPTAQLAGATVLTSGIHAPEIRVTIGNVIIARPLPPFRVQ